MGTNLAFARPIFCLAATLFVLGSNLAFKKWTYAIIAIIFDFQIELITNNLDVLVYLSTGCGVTLGIKHG